MDEHPDSPALGTAASRVLRPAALRPRWALVVGTFFGAGLAPRAPGTAGSVASLALWAPLVLVATPWWVRALVVVAVFALGTLASNALVRSAGRQDPQFVVVDEVAGMGVALLLASASWWTVLAGLVCFRVFDIWKPGPVRLADRRVKGGFGVMLDDVVAGILALPCVWAFDTWVRPLLGAGAGA